MPIVKGTKIKGTPLVSAVIAAYNEELHLADCINSLLNQQYPKIDTIVVENGESKDRTYEIAKEYALSNKNVKAFSIPGKQKGPGNAWNFGVKKAKGEIVMICGADLIYGENYVRLGIIPILNGETVGTTHIEETCKNSNNLWARAFFYKRKSTHRDNLSRVFTLVRKDFVSKRPFNSAFGYADDQTVYRTEGTEFPCVNIDIYQTNPASFSDTWDHTVWVGKSMSKKSLYFFLLGLPIFPLFAIYKTVKQLKEDFYLPFIFFLPIYYSLRHFAYAFAAIRKLL